MVRVSRDVGNSDYQSGLEDSTSILFNVNLMLLYTLSLDRSYSEPSPDSIRRTNSIANSKPSHAPPPPPVTMGHESPKVI